MPFFVIGNKAFTSTGYGPKIGSTKQTWEYDALNDSWTRKADFPGPAREFATGFSIGNKGYLCGGSCCGVNVGYSDLWEYDPAADIWAKKTSFPGPARDMSIGFSIGNKGYFGTGRAINTNNACNDFWEYDQATNTWTKLANVPGLGRGEAVAFTIGSKAYVGYGFSMSSIPQTDFYEFDPLSNTWITKCTAGFSASSTACFAIGNRGYVGTGGINSDSCSNQLWEYDPVINTWTQSDSLPAARRCDASGFAIGGKGYIGFGDINNWTLPNDVYQYTPREYYLFVNESKLTPNISVYPNPTTGKFSIESSEKLSSIAVMNLLGQSVHSVNSPFAQFSIDLSDQPKGIYFVEMISEKGRCTKKIILE
jgi:N-acetylneuraminic acid mutarotase